MAFPLHNAARNGDVASLTAQIGEGANLELRDAQASAAAESGVAPVARCMRVLDCCSVGLRSLAVC